ncbi:hypothetical protein JCM10212_001307 [Sporobolomyces blumeae]
MSTLTPVLSTAPPPELSTPGLVVLFGNSPNGWKITIALEALKSVGAIPDYTGVTVFLQSGEQFQPWFKELNPNSKMPVLIDNRADKPRLVVFESGAILEYLARVYDRNFDFSFDDDDLHQEMVNWIHLAQANLGPQQGQVNHFSRYSKVKCEYSLERFTTEVKRIYQVYEDHLSGAGTPSKTPREFLVGGKPSFADFCTQPWLRCAFWGGLDISPASGLGHLAAYVERIEQITFVQHALKVPEQDLVTRIRSNPDLERQIMEKMKKQRDEQEQAKDE